MKKSVVAIISLLVIALTLSVAASAAPGAFVQSPSNNGAPTIVEASNKDCSGEIVITAYRDRANLSAAEVAALEAAYATISDNSVKSTLQTIADDNKIDVSILSVSDLFNMGYKNCADHSGHGAFDVVLDSATLENFAALLVYENGAWKVVEDTKINKDGHLEAEIDTFGPYAIVVHDGSVELGGGFPWWIIIVAGTTVVGGGGAAVVIIIIKRRKK